MKNKFLSILSILLIAICILTGCGGSVSGQRIEVASGVTSMDSANMVGLTMNSMASLDYGEKTAEEAVAEEIGIDNNLTENRKLIKTINIDMESTDFDQAIEAINNEVTKYGGYIENSSISGNSIQNEGTRYSSFTLRIPTTNLDNFLNQINTIGNITYKSENVDDVTMQYSDTETHLKILRTEQESLTNLLETATNMEDILTIRTRLNEIQYEIESYQTQLNIYDNQIEYTTIYLSVNEVKLYTSAAEDNMFKRMSDGIKENLLMLETFFTNLLIGIVANLPTIILLIVLGFSIVKISIACKKRINRKKVEKSNNLKEDKSEQKLENKKEES